MPDTEIVLADWQIIDLELAVLVGERCIGMIDNQPVCVHPGMEVAVHSYRHRFCSRIFENLRLHRVRCDKRSDYRRRRKSDFANKDIGQHEGRVHLVGQSESPDGRCQQEPISIAWCLHLMLQANHFKKCRLPFQYRHPACTRTPSLSPICTWSDWNS